MARTIKEDERGSEVSGKTNRTGREAGDQIKKKKTTKKEGGTYKRSCRSNRTERDMKGKREEP